MLSSCVTFSTGTELSGEFIYRIPSTSITAVHTQKIAAIIFFMLNPRFLPNYSSDSKSRDSTALLPEELPLPEEEPPEDELLPEDELPLPDDEPPPEDELPDEDDEPPDDELPLPDDEPPPEDELLDDEPLFPEDLPDDELLPDDDVLPDELLPEDLPDDELLPGDDVLPEDFDSVFCSGFAVALLDDDFGFSGLSVVILSAS